MGGTRDRLASIFLVGLASLLPPAGTRAQEVKPDPCRDRGVIWCASARGAPRGAPFELPVEQLALRAAPILWFSPDEPLLLTDHEIPQERRCSCCEPEPAKGRVVYYRISKVLVRDKAVASTRAAIRGGRLPLQSVSRLTMSYYFYYERDFGLNPHCHDLEGAEFEIDIDPAGDGLYRAVLTRVRGLAHGSRLLSNVLQITSHVRNRQGAPDVRLPVSLLVEEGKHASCPDRNGDGEYTPGYDVNVRMTDAWGLRDIFGSGVVRSRYEGWMTKPRKLEDRVGPDLADDDTLVLQAGALTPYAAGPKYPEKRYRLELAGREKACPPSSKKSAFIKERCPEDAHGIGREGQNSLNMARSTAEKFSDPEVTDSEAVYHWGRGWVLQPVRYMAVSARLDGDDPGFAVGLYPGYGLPKFGGWFNLRGTLTRDDGRWRGSLDLLFTPSATRLADWYAGGGIDFNGRISSALEDSDEDLAVEAGLQVRVNAVGIRLGVRSALDEGRFRRTRLVWELGWGPDPMRAGVH